MHGAATAFASSPFGLRLCTSSLSQRLNLCRLPKVVGPRVGPLSMASSSATSPAPGTVSEWATLTESVPQPDWSRGDYISMPTKIWEGDRLYDKFEKKDIRVVLYRDAAYWCPYCIRIQLLLERKKIPYTLVKENMRCYGKKSPEFLAIVPSGLLPVVRIDGRVITESLDIMFEIEQQFPGAPYEKSLPVDDNDKMQAFHQYVRLERVMAGAWLNMVRGPQLRPKLAVEQFHTTMDLVDSALGEFAGCFFLSSEEEGPGFVDILFAGFLERIRSSVAYWRNIDVLNGRPNLTAWFAAMEGWTPYANHRGDDLSHILALPPQFGNVKFTGERTEVSTIIDRQRALFVLNDGPEGANARTQAASAIVRNVDIVIPDAIKGGKATAKAEQALVDVAFRIMVSALMDPDNLEDLESALIDAIPSTSRVVVGNCLRFERGRCCTPRDMPVPALEQFSGVINWALDVLGCDKGGGGSSYST